MTEAIKVLRLEIKQWSLNKKIMQQCVTQSPEKHKKDFYKGQMQVSDHVINELRAAIRILSASCLIFLLSCQEPHRTPMHDVKPKEKIDTVKIKI